MTSRQYFNKENNSFDMWVAAFNPRFGCQEIALDFCINTINEAIGKLEAELAKIKKDEEDKSIKELFGEEWESVSHQPNIQHVETPKAFIVHGGRSRVLDKLREYIEAFNIKPIIVELSASKGMSVDDKVNKYIKDADFGIVLATKGGIVDTTGKSPKLHPRLNVIDELERLRAVFTERTILLLENGVDLPSNVSGLTYERFARQSMDRAFTAIVRELIEMGILKAVKPQK